MTGNLIVSYWMLVLCLMLRLLSFAQTDSDISKTWSDLIMASGNALDFPPKLAFTDKVAFGPAYYVSGENTVYVHSGLLDSLESILGTDTAKLGLTYVLAHELAHAVDGHIASHFAKRNIRGTSASASQRENRDKFSLQHESEADRLAGIYTHVMGLDCLESAPAALDVIYSLYGIPDTIPGYPSLGERKVIARKVALQLEEVSLIYDAALFTVGLGLHDNAIPLLETVLRDVNYKASEVYELLALAHFKKGIALLGDEDLISWQFPIQLSTRAFSKRLTRANNQQDKEEAISQLNLSVKWGEKGTALKSQSNVFPGIVESAKWTIFFVENDEKSRKNLVQEIQDLEARVLFQALELFVANKLKKAKKKINDKEFTVFDDHVRINQALLNYELKPSVQTYNRSACIDWSEFKSEAMLTSLFSELGYKSLKINYKVSLKVKSGENVTILKLPDSFDKAIAFWDDDSQIQLPCEFEFGITTLQEVLSLFNSGASLTQLSTSTMLSHRNEDIVFHFGRDEKLRGVVWLID